MNIRLVIALGVVATACGLGCREQDPPLKYNYAMADSEGGRRLLPVVRSVGGSRDASILKNPSATIIRRDEMDSPEAAAMVSGDSADEAVDSGPPTTPAEALKKVGETFFGSFMNPGSGSTGEPAAESGATGGDTSAGSAGGDDAVRQLLGAYSSDLAAGNYLKLAAHCASSQKVNAVDYFEILDEMNTSLSSLLAAYEKSSPGVKAKYEQVLSQKRAEAAIDAVSVNGANATADLSGADNKSMSYALVAENGEWRLVHPVIEAASDWATFKDELDSHVESIDDEVDELSGGGTPDNSKLDKLIETAIDYLSAVPQ